MNWFKFYGQDWLTDTKVIGLSIEDRLCFITLLCLASASDEMGIVKNCTEEAIKKITHLYQNPYESDDCEWSRAEGFLQRLIANGMITNDNGTVVIINFAKRQGQSLTG